MLDERIWAFHNALIGSKSMDTHKEMSIEQFLEAVQEKLEDGGTVVVNIHSNGGTASLYVNEDTFDPCLFELFLDTVCGEFGAEADILCLDCKAVPTPIGCGLN